MEDKKGERVEAIPAFLEMQDSYVEHDADGPFLEEVSTVHIGQVVQIRMKTRIKEARAMWADICGKCGAHRSICPHEDS